MDEKLFGPDHTSTARDCHTLGKVLIELGKIDEARRQLQRAGSIREEFQRKTGHAHPDWERTRQDLARAVDAAEDS